MRWDRNRRDFIKKAGLGCLSIATVGARSNASEQRASASKRPNVILIMSDDQGYGDFGVMGNPLIQTPNIDAMAKRSASMSNFYVSPVCSPTRACLMTGRYNYRTRCIDTYIGRSMMDTKETTVAELMRDAGYATGVFGKWHLGDHYPMRPMEQGFETSLVLRGGGIGQPSDPPGGEGKYTDPILYDNGREVHAKGYCTDVYFDSAMKWMEKCTKEDRNFFAYIPTNAPHSPFDDVPKRISIIIKPRILTTTDFHKKKATNFQKNATKTIGLASFPMITNIDENMGKLFKKLDEMGIAENTLIFYLVDNGPNGRRYVKGMRGMKSEVYEGGVRSPLWVQWPAVLKEGLSTDRIAAHIDILPTILDACGVKKPDSLKLDGRSFLPLLKGAKIKSDDRTIVIQSHRGDKPVLYHNFAARSQKWKLLHASGFGKEKL